MNPEDTDWLKLWRELVMANSSTERPEQPGNCHKRLLKKTQERHDPILDFVMQEIGARDTVLDIGAGSGRWSTEIAKIAASVTSIEPSDDMVNRLREKISAIGLSNIQVLKTTWENAVVGIHDVVTCAHSIYFSPDFDSFIRKMQESAGKKCYLVLRLPPYEGIIGELSLKIHGSRHDSVNAVIAYNALYSMGIYANVLVEDSILHWVDPTFEQAFNRAKRHLRLESTVKYDRLIKDTLASRLNYVDKVYMWPDGMRSALLWWSPSAISK